MNTVAHPVDKIYSAISKKWLEETDHLDANGCCGCDCPDCSLDTDEEMCCICPDCNVECCDLHVIKEEKVDGRSH
jgi:hypothetical protein